MSHHRLAGLALSLALGIIALLHAYWALGGRRGLDAALGGADKTVFGTLALYRARKP
jgi:hypothetical protein